MSYSCFFPKNFGYIIRCWPSFRCWFEINPTWFDKIKGKTFPFSDLDNIKEESQKLNPSRITIHHPPFTYTIRAIKLYKSLLFYDSLPALLSHSSMTIVWCLQYVRTVFFFLSQLKCPGSNWFYQMTALTQRAELKPLKILNAPF